MVLVSERGLTLPSSGPAYGTPLKSNVRPHVTSSKPVSSETVDPAHESCGQCGHNWNAHRLCGYGDPPTEGWMECPVEGCECRKTWGLSPEVAARVKERALNSAPAPAISPGPQNESSRRRKAVINMRVIPRILVALLCFGPAILLLAGVAPEFARPTRTSTWALHGLLSVWWGRTLTSVVWLALGWLCYRAIFRSKNAA